MQSLPIPATFEMLSLKKSGQAFVQLGFSRHNARLDDSKQTTPIKKNRHVQWNEEIIPVYFEASRDTISIKEYQIVHTFWSDKDIVGDIADGVYVCNERFIRAFLVEPKTREQDEEEFEKERVDSFCY